MTDERKRWLDELEALAEPTTAPQDLRARLLASTESTNRFEDLLELVARDADLSPEETSALLLAIDDASRWSPGPTPDLSLLHFDGGPATAGAITGFVRIAPGGRFPEHDHGGEEIGVILQGRVRDTATGEIHGRGARLVHQPGTEHALEAVSKIPVVYLAVAHVGVVLGGQLIGPDDARL
ncbi:MAG: cupin domain-containing protein [Sandaracinus sp.]|nr:cupin domain-containing protein [Sandaracinus sp.]